MGLPTSLKTTWTAPYSRSIELDPKFAYAYSERGEAYSLNKDFDRAMADTNRAIELDPKFAIAYVLRGFVHANKKDHDSAIDYNRAIEINPKLAIAYVNRGVTYANKGHNKSAIADNRKSLELDPKNTVARDGLKRLGLTH